MPMFALRLRRAAFRASKTLEQFVYLPRLGLYGNSDLVMQEETASRLRV
jgi:hypothetical protein